MILKDRKVLAKLMVIEDVTQRDLAAAAGWNTHSYVGRLIRGEATRVAPKAASRIAAYLGVDRDVLFTE